jgi:lipopolysaccharide export LptBFGC system permease protein LptF
VEESVISTLDRHLAGQFAKNAALVASATVVVFVVLDVLLGFQLLTRPAPSPWTKVELFACRIPSLLNFAIPVSAVVAALATVAPMLRRGEFTALGSAGITLQRSTRALLIGCLLLGVVDTVIADLASPPATARAIALQDLLEGQNREGRVWRTDAGATWFASGAKLVGTDQPALDRVVVANSDIMALADQVAWDGTRWTAPAGSIVLRIVGGAQRLERLPPGALPPEIPLQLNPSQLYDRLLPRYTMTTRELLARGERADLATVWARCIRLLVPALAAMSALAMFVRFRNRDRVAVATVESVATALIPVALLMVVGMTADTAPGPPGLAVLIGCCLASAPAVWWWWRWRL